ncbi:hypothetical protein [Cronobacter dublinensis]|uniref:hypothetical protein n=1 Tax=Cronobacter dublinensis TaxID=413497 RepID=UPI00300DE245
MNVINNILATAVVDLKRKTFYLDFLFLFICVWTLIASGSEAQYYLFKFINSDSSSLYGSVFEDAIARIPTFNEYIKGAYSVSRNYGYLAALLIVSVSLFYQTTVQVFIVSVISSAFGLTITDFIMFVVEKSLTSQAILESIIANTLGAPIIASFIVLLFYIKKALFDLPSVGLALRFVTNYVIYILICFLILLATYYIVCFFYRPTEVNFSVSTSESFSGDYFINKNSNAAKKENISEKQKRFSLLSSPVEVDGSIQVFGQVESIHSRFKKNKTYTIKVLPLLNCIDGHSVNVALSNYLIYDGVKSLSIRTSEPITTITLKDKSGYVKSNDEIVNMFSVEKNNKNSFDITKINDGAFSYYPSDFDGAMYIATGVVDFEGEQSKKEVNYTLIIDGVEKKVHVEVNRLRSINAERKLQCQISPATESSNNIYIKAGESVYVGVLIKLVPEQKNEYYSDFHASDSKFDVNGKLLYAQVKDASQKDLMDKYFSDGYLDGFILHSFDKLSLDGKSVDSNKMDNLMVMGKGIYGHVSSGNNLVISGKADLFYKNRLRQNKTLWETSSDNTIILGGVGTLLVSLLLWFINRVCFALKKNENINIF